MGRLSPGPRWFRRASTLLATGAPLVAISSLMLGIGPLSGTDPASAGATGGNALAPLSSVPVPQPSDLAPYIADQTAVVQLGKALFWDMQVGSDGVQSCASCHYAAGADARSVNAMNPDTRAAGGGGSFSPGHGPNQSLQASDFPFHQLANPADHLSALITDSADVVSSPGVFNVAFAGIEVGNAIEPGGNAGDDRFQQGGVSTRRVPPRNAPSAINAVFNGRQFWDGRAQGTFNGVNPFGDRDPDARVLRATPAGLEPFQVSIQRASLASQAVGPPGSDFEMSHSGRAFRDIGKKVLSLVPLSRQRVNAADGVLGSLAADGGQSPGLSTTYDALLRQAFKPEWWNSDKIVRVDADGNPTVADRPNRPLLGSEYELGAYNFSLFFGLAVMEYERTLVSDQTPLDRFLAGDTTALTPLERQGMAIFTGQGSCASCHGGAEMTAASVAGLEAEPIESMVMGNGGTASYDAGFYNIGLRSPAEDIGNGGLDPWGNALSTTRFLGAAGRTAVDGAFKSPSLRNVALTAPYFHNGGAATLRQVVEFYNRGGDFPEANAANLDSDVEPLGLTAQQEDALVAFLEALTDPRVDRQCGPFDHPELFVVNGHRAPDGSIGTTDRGDGAAADTFLRLPDTGPDCEANPQAPRFLQFTGPEVTPPDPQPLQPETTLVSRPKDGARTVAPTFSGGEPRLSSGKTWFECRLDGTAWKPCTSGQTFRVGEGPHLFTTRAASANGARDRSPASAAWWVPYATTARYSGPSLIPGGKATLVAADVKAANGCHRGRLVRFTITNRRGTFALGATRTDALGRAVATVRTKIAAGPYTLNATAVGSRACSAATGTARVAVRSGTAALRGAGRTAHTSFSLKTNSQGIGTLSISAPRALQVIGRIDAAVQDGDEGVVTGTARVRYWDARRGQFGKQARAVRFTFSFRAGRHGAIRLVLPASGRTPTAAGWTPVNAGGVVRALRAR
ncbi:MAG: hypothetical protein QOE98_1180 [Gaiellaceae bacterium]|nr:hypothetical protein [Gaiellaceae bacterium]